MEVSEWRLYICSDCDTDKGAVIVQKAVDAPHEAGCGLDFCPGCGSYLSFTPWGKVEVSGSALTGLRNRAPAGDDE